MAALDSLLSLALSRGASELELSPGAPPALGDAGLAAPLSMPPLSAASMRGLLAGVVDDALLEGDGVAGEVAWVTGDGRAWTVSLTPRAGGPVVRVRAAGATRAAAAPEESAAPVEPSSPTAPGELAALVARAAARGATDVLLSVGRQPRRRTASGWSEMRGSVPTEEDLVALLGSALTPPHADALARTGTTDVAWTVPSADGTPARRTRVNVFRHRGGLAAAVRILRPAPASLRELGLPADLTGLVGHRHGLVLFTGPTGSGKTTTMVALVAHLARTRACHVVTLEDPVEYTIPDGRGLVHQREVGVDVESFEAGLRAALRERPDVILLGEMRDPGTISAALRAAETGHLVLSTLHCGAAPLAVDRICDAFPESARAETRAQLAGVLRAVVTQVMLEAPSKGAAAPSPFLIHAQGADLDGAGGAETPAVTVAVERLVCTPAVAALIREGRTHQLRTALQTGKDAGMVPLERSLADLVRAGRVTQAAAREAPPDAAMLDELLR